MPAKSLCNKKKQLNSDFFPRVILCWRTHCLRKRTPSKERDSCPTQAPQINIVNQKTTNFNQNAKLKKMKIYFNIVIVYNFIAYVQNSTHIRTLIFEYMLFFFNSGHHFEKSGHLEPHQKYAKHRPKCLN